MKKQRSLKISIFVLFISMIILSTLTVAGFGFLNSYNYIMAQTEDKIMLELQHNANYFSGWFNTQKTLLTSIAQEVEAKELYSDKKSLEKYFAQRAGEYPYLLSIYMVTEENEMIDSTFWIPDEGYNGPSRDWYIAAKDSDEVAMISPYIDSQTGSTIITVSKRIMNNSKRIGVICFDITADNLAEMVKKSGEDQDSYVFILDKNGNILMHPDKSLAPDGEGNIKNLSSLKGYEALSSKDALSSMKRFKSYEGEERFFKLAPIQGSDWNIVVSYTTSHMGKRFFTEAAFTLSIMAIIFFMSFIIVNIFYRKYIAPIRKICEALDEMSHGNIHVNVEGAVAKSAEIQSLKVSVGNVTDTLMEYILEISSVLTKLSQNDFTATIEGNYLGDFASIKISLVQIIASLNGTLENISNVSENVKSGAEAVAQGAASLSAGVSEQADSIQEMNTMLADITQRVGENAQEAKTGSDASHGATLAVESSNKQMAELLDAIEEIHASSREIEKIIKTIENIAFQTNILALNAAVEAARAGSAGKGFAVVADEVRNLAIKSSEAAKSTTELIQNSIKAVNRGVSLANLTAGDLDKIVDGAKFVTGTIQKISAESLTQAEELKALTGVIDSINAVVQSNGAASDISVDTAKQLAVQAETLDRQVKCFKLNSSEHKNLPN